MVQARGILRHGVGALLLLLLWSSSGSVSSLRGVRADAPWLPPVRLSQSLADSSHPALAVTTDGQVHAVWEQDHVLYHTYKGTSGWTAPARVTPGESATLAAGPNGSLHLAYICKFEDLWRVFYCDWNGAQWSRPTMVSAGGANAGEPRLAADGAGRVAIIWASHEAGAPPNAYAPLHYTTTDSGLRSDLPLLVGGTFIKGRHPALAYGPDGALYAAWEACDVGEVAPEICYAVRSGDQWSDGWFCVSYAPDVPSTLPDIAIDPDGRSCFVWQEGPASASGPTGIFFNTADGGPSGRQALASGASASGPRLSIDRQGGLHVVWSEGGNTLRYRHAPAADAAWEAPLGLTTAAHLQDVAVAVDSAGSIHVVWAQSEAGGVLEIYYLAWEPESATPTAEPSPTSTPTESVSTPAPSASATSVPTETSTATATATPSATASLEASATATQAAETSTPSSTPPVAPWSWQGHLPFVGTAAPGPGLAGRPPAPAIPTFRLTSLVAGGHRVLASDTTTGTVRLSDADVAARNPAIAITPAGVVHVVWEQGEALYHSYLSASGWTTPTYVAIGESPALAAGPDGQLHLAFVCQFDGNFEIYHVSWSGNRWSVWHPVSRTHSGASSLPDIAVAPDGVVHIAWTDTSPGYPVIYYAYDTTANPGLFSSMPVPNASGSAPTLALTGDGPGQVAVHLAWQDHDGDTTPLEIFYTVYEGGAWELAQNVSASPDADSRSPDLVVEGEELRLVWQENGSSRTVRTVRGHSNWWPLPAAVSPEGEAAYLPAVASAGCLTHVAWDTGTAVRLSQSFSSASVWPQPTTLVEGVDEATDVAVAAGPEGVAHVVWAQRQSGRWEIHYVSHTFQPAFVAHFGLILR